jgi:integrase
MGLGPVAIVPITNARQRAGEARRQLLDGIDPLEARKARTEAREMEASQATTFAACAERYIASGKLDGLSPKQIREWQTSLPEYAYPHIGDLPVSQVDIHLVRKILDPIWFTKTSAAGRVRQRVEAILDWAAIHNYRTGENPARWKGHLDQVYPAKSKIAPVKHHPALPYLHLQQFMAELRERKGLVPSALEFLILTGSRTKEVLKAPCSEINLAEQTWTIPPLRMKNRRLHRVPLAGRALEIATGMVGTVVSLGLDPSKAYLFRGQGGFAKHLNDGALLELLRSMRSEFNVHGLRSTFRTWVEEQTNYPHEVKEAALSHTIGNKVETAYNRSDLFQKRRQLMIDWANFCVSK